MLCASGGVLMDFHGNLLHRYKKLLKKLVVYAAPVLIIFFIANLSAPNSVIDRRTPGKLLTHNLAGVPSNAILISNDNLISAVCRHFKRTDVVF